MATRPNRHAVHRAADWRSTCRFPTCRTVPAACSQAIPIRLKTHRPVAGQTGGHESHSAEIDVPALRCIEQTSVHCRHAHKHRVFARNGTTDHIVGIEFGAATLPSRRRSMPHAAPQSGHVRENRQHAIAISCSASPRCVTKLFRFAVMLPCVNVALSAGGRTRRVDRERW